MKCFSTDLMHKYSGKTYSRSRKREATSATIFDDVQNEETNCNDESSLNSSKNPLSTSLPKKSSWSRVQKAVGHVQKNSPSKNTMKGSKKTKKLEAIDEDDPFAFSDEDTHNSKPSSQKSSQKSLDSVDKSTDDEAYSSSQESVDSSSKSSQQSRGKKSKPIIQHIVSTMLNRN